MYEIEFVFGVDSNFIFVDFRALLQSEATAALNGKQWLLSCFGPFKESTVLPNFINDRCFEEVRLDFMENAKTGQQQQHVNELITQCNDAVSKLNQLKVPSADTIQLVAQIYNESIQEQKQPTQTSPGSNVFGHSNALTTAPQQQSNPFQMSSAFGAPQQQQATAMNAGSIFGAPTSNPFQAATTQSSIFGAPKEQQVPASNFTFSLSQQQQPQPQLPQQSIFGSSVQSPPQNSIFGSPQPLQQQPQGSSIFGTQPNSFTSGSSMFGGGAQQQQPQAQQQQQGSSIFGQTSIFAQPPQQQQQVPATGIFGSSQPQPQETFPQAAQNVFGHFQAQQQITSQPQASLFAQPVAAPPQSIFGVQQSPLIQQAPPQTQPTGSIFQIQQQPQSTNASQTFGANPFQTQPPPIDESAYSKPEDLTPDEMEAFQAEMFQVGNIPLKPPPKHLCV